MPLRDRFGLPIRDCGRSATINGLPMVACGGTSRFHVVVVTHNGPVQIPGSPLHCVVRHRLCRYHVAISEDNTRTAPGHTCCINVLVVRAPICNGDRLSHHTHLRMCLSSAVAVCALMANRMLRPSNAHSLFLIALRALEQNKVFVQIRPALL